MRGSTWSFAHAALQRPGVPTRGFFRLRTAATRFSSTDVSFSSSRTWYRDMSAPCPTFGFIVHLEPRADVDRARVVRSFMHEAVEDRGLRCTGLGARTLEYVIAG